jgi:hypothetical protein
MPNPWVSLRCDQLIPVNKDVNEKEQFEKGPEEEEKRSICTIRHVVKHDTQKLGLIRIGRMTQNAVRRNFH